jgi:hypothetical protein
VECPDGGEDEARAGAGGLFFFFPFFSFFGADSGDERFEPVPGEKRNGCVEEWLDPVSDALGGQDEGEGCVAVEAGAEFEDGSDELCWEVLKWCGRWCWRCCWRWRGHLVSICEVSWRMRWATYICNEI